MPVSVLEPATPVWGPRTQRPRGHQDRRTTDMMQLRLSGNQLHLCSEFHFGPYRSVFLDKVRFKIHVKWELSLSTLHQNKIRYTPSSVETPTYLVKIHLTVRKMKHVVGQEDFPLCVNLCFMHRTNVVHNLNPSASLKNKILQKHGKWRLLSSLTVLLRNSPRATLCQLTDVIQIC